MALPKEKLLALAEDLIIFEEELSSCYTLASGIYRDMDEFWTSAALVKQTRASLFANIRADIEEHAIDYIAERESSGTYMNFLNKIKTSRERLSSRSISPDDFIRLAREIEIILLENSAVPRMGSQRGAFRTINSVLTAVQRNQVRLFDGLIQHRQVILHQPPSQT